MEYRKLPHGQEEISVIGIGMGSIHESDPARIQETLKYAMDHGINFFDMVASEKVAYAPYGKAFEGVRDKVYLQMHFGATYESGKYGWTRDLDTIKSQFQWQLDVLGTDYTDFGFVHCMDDLEDFETVMKNGQWDYMKGLKEEGIIRHLGLSSHNPEIVRRFLDTGMLDLVMFSINPTYDYTETDEYGIGSLDERGQMYRECQKAGVGISVMKPFGGGQLLDEKRSPMGKAMTRIQCIQYALDRPGVLTVLPGIRGMEDLKDILAYEQATEEEKDYSMISTLTPESADGICVYCNHCQPCPMNIDIGLINKYYDLALSGDELAKGHYEKLSVKADACVQCGHCESHCPFHVKQEQRLEEITNYFG